MSGKFIVNFFATQIVLGNIKKRNKQWKNKENTICHANDYTIRRGIAYKTGI